MVVLVFRVDKLVAGVLRRPRNHARFILLPSFSLGPVWRYFDRTARKFIEESVKAVAATRHRQCFQLLDETSHWSFTSSCGDPQRHVRPPSSIVNPIEWWNLVENTVAEFHSQGCICSREETRRKENRGKRKKINRESGNNYLKSTTRLIEVWLLSAPNVSTQPRARILRARTLNDVVKTSTRDFLENS